MALVVETRACLEESGEVVIAVCLFLGIWWFGVVLHYVVEVKNGGGKFGYGYMGDLCGGVLYVGIAALISLTGSRAHV